MLLRPLLTAAALVAVTAVGIAQTDPIAKRREIMKGVGAAARTGTQMVKGEAPFDLAKAQQVLSTFAAAAKDFHTNFPDNSKTGGETTAAPAIWENPADFRARFEKFSADIQQAAAQTKDLPTFQAAFGSVTQNCGACHKIYRIKT